MSRLPLSDPADGCLQASITGLSTEGTSSGTAISFAGAGGAAAAACRLLATSAGVIAAASDGVLRMRLMRPRQRVGDSAIRRARTLASPAEGAASAISMASARQVDAAGAACTVVALVVPTAIRLKAAALPESSARSRRRQADIFASEALARWNVDLMHFACFCDAMGH